MTHKPLTYFEKLEHLYILMETKEMLQKKLNSISEGDSAVINEDINKIEKEILELTGGKPIENIGEISSNQLLNPFPIIDSDNNN